MNKSPWRTLAAGCIIAAGFLFVALAYFVGLDEQNAANRDYIGYWAAGQLLVQHKDPYDGSATLQLERAKGYIGKEPRLTPSPPVALLLVVPLGFLGAKNGLIFWLLLQLVCLSLSVWILWILHGRPANRYHLFGYLFAPAIACLMAGQLGTFFLLAVVLFLYFHKFHPALAGAALVPCVLKPHLFVPFAAALLVWLVSRKAYRIVLGFVIALIVNSAVAVYFVHNIWSDYSQMMRASGIQSRFTPTLSLTLRELIPPHAVWVQYILLVIACIWAIRYFWRRRNTWDWHVDGMLPLLVSVVCAPYAWFTDESVVLPAILAGIYAASNSRRALLPIALFGGAALAEVFFSVDLNTRYYLWTAPAWLAWYIYANWPTAANAEAAHPREQAIAE
jgi:hypothetical protein